MQFLAACPLPGGSTETWSARGGLELGGYLVPR